MDATSPAPTTQSDGYDGSGLRALCLRKAVAPAEAARDKEKGRHAAGGPRPRDLAGLPGTCLVRASPAHARGRRPTRGTHVYSFPRQHAVTCACVQFPKAVTLSGLLGRLPLPPQRSTGDTTRVLQ